MKLAVFNPLRNMRVVLALMGAWSRADCCDVDGSALVVSFLKPAGVADVRHAWIYEYCTGNIYGKQVEANVWKDKVHSDRTSHEFGFIEVETTHSLYYNPAKSMHVESDQAVNPKTGKDLHGKLTGARD